LDKIQSRRSQLREIRGKECRFSIARPAAGLQAFSLSTTTGRPAAEACQRPAVDPSEAAPQRSLIQLQQTKDIVMVDTDSMTRDLARYALADFKTIDPELIQAARRRVLEAVSVAFLGMDQKAHPATKAVLTFAEPFVRRGGESRIWGTGSLVPADIATLANGVFLRNADGNDSYFGPATNVHPSDSISALIALAEEESRSGYEVLEATLIAYELAVTCCDMWPDLGDRGWDQTNHVQIATVLSIGRLLRMSQEQLQNAIGMAVVPRGGMFQARAGSPSSWKSFSGADAARHALYVCRLAQAGAEGPNEPFEGPAGFLKQVGDGVVPEKALTAIRERRMPSRIYDTNIKYRPVASPVQAAVHASALVSAQLEKGEKVVDVTVTTYERAATHMADEAHSTPKSRKMATHSLPYVVFATLEDGDIYQAFDDVDRIASERTHAFIRDHIKIVGSPEMTAIFPGRMPAAVAVVTSKGRKIEEYVEAAPGFVGNPVTDQQLEDKFRKCAGPYLGSRTEEAVELLRRFDRLKDVTQLTRLLSPQ
jgi:2-methylcitrate dehydratase